MHGSDDYVAGDADFHVHNTTYSFRTKYSMLFSKSTCVCLSGRLSGSESGIEGGEDRSIYVSSVQMAGAGLGQNQESKLHPGFLCR